VLVNRVVRHLNVAAVPLKGFFHMNAASWTHAIFIRSIITWLKSGLTWWYSPCFEASIVAVNQKTATGSVHRLNLMSCHEPTCNAGCHRGRSFAHGCGLNTHEHQVKCRYCAIAVPKALRCIRFPDGRDVHVIGSSHACSHRLPA